MNKTLALVAAALAIAASPASADYTHHAVVTVETSDLDLASASDQERLEARMDREIRRACRIGGKGLEIMHAEAQCRADLRETARTKVALAVAQARTERLASNAIGNQG